MNFRPFRNLYHDIIGLHDRWSSDFVDVTGKYRQNVGLMLSSVVLMFSILLAPCLTFGSLLNTQVDPRMTIYSVLMCTGFCQVFFTLLCGQPLLIIGISGPTFIIEMCIALITDDLSNKLPLLRFQVAVSCALTTLLLLSLNITRLTSYVRRSLEEIFNFFISIYFIFKASKTIFKDIMTKTDSASLSMSLKSLFLAIFMVANCLYLSYVKKSFLLRRSIRNALGFFNVPIGLALCTIIDVFIFRNINSAYSMKKMEQMNANNKSLVLDAASKPILEYESIFRMHFLNNFMVNYPNLTIVEHVSAVGIGICLSLFIFTESMLSGLTVAKAERRLKKPCLFAMDYIIIGCLIPMISGLMFWPFLTCNPVKSNANVISLTIWDIKTMPGVPHKILGCIEQRVTNIAIGVLLASTVLISQRFFDIIPTGALLGIFVYMGIMGLCSLIITRRLAAMMKRRKYWSDKDNLSQYPSGVVYAFVSIQLLFIFTLISLNVVTEFAQIAITSLIFPIILFSYAVIREVFMPTINFFGPYINKIDKYHEIPKIGFLDRRTSTNDEIEIEKSHSIEVKHSSFDPPSPKASWIDQDETLRHLIEMNTRLLMADEEVFEGENVESRLNNPYNVY